MPELHALVLLGKAEDAGALDLSGVKGLQFYELYPPGDELEMKKRLEPLFMHQCLCSALIQTLKQEIVLYYRAHQRPIVTVYVPEQDVTEGVLQLIVVEGKLGKVSVCGNRWFSDDSYLDAVSLTEGGPICIDQLLDDVSWLHRNPFRCVDALFKPGDECGTTDLELVVHDRLPVQLYVGGDNTGTEVTGHARWFTGITWGDFLWLGHQLNYQYSTSSNPHRFQSHTVHYTAPLPWHHLFRAFGGYAIVHPDMTDFRSNGTTFQSSLRYTLPQGRNCSGTLKEWTVGFDFKNTNNNLLFVAEEEIAIITQTVNLTQFLLGFQYAHEDSKKKIGFSADLFWSPGQMVPDQTDARYNELSPGAVVKYVYGNVTFAGTWALPYRHALFTQIRAQGSNQSLLPSEQFGLGGYDTVRGYEEREFNADDALCVNVELRTRPFSVLRFFNACKRDDALYFLFFFDYGLGHLIHQDNDFPYVNANPKIPQTEYLMSIGPGFRYNWGRYVSARLDWGVKLHRTVFGDSARSMFHLGLVVSF